MPLQPMGPARYGGLRTMASLRYMPPLFSPVIQPRRDWSVRSPAFVVISNSSMSVRCMDCSAFTREQIPLSLCRPSSRPAGSCTRSRDACMPSPAMASFVFRGNSCTPFHNETCSVWRQMLPVTFMWEDWTVSTVCKEARNSCCHRWNEP